MTVSPTSPDPVEIMQRGVCAAQDYDPDELIPHPASKSWEPPSMPRWQAEGGYGEDFRDGIAALTAAGQVIAPALKDEELRETIGRAAMKHFHPAYEHDRDAGNAIADIIMPLIAAREAVLRKKYEAELDRCDGEQTKAEADRDALCAALGFKPGPLGGSREIVLKDAAGLRPAMVDARRKAERVQSDADLWMMSVLEGERQPLLVKVWEQRQLFQRDLQKAQSELATLRTQLADMAQKLVEAGERDKALEKALRPFADHAAPEGADGKCVLYGTMRDRICDWLGPSAFLDARAAISPKPLDPRAEADALEERSNG